MYYHPENYGLELVGTAEDTSLGYEFDMFCVWKDAEGRLYWASDSGCSCPEPFGSITVDDLGTGTPAQAGVALMEWASSDTDWRNVTASAAALQDKLAGLTA
jgi:hypothetical protein